ncbi:hypothetical protein Esi_0089_0094 [Ectocarpus siliculosus]|uniref:Uncharacterized protein n=1 Tax=Ectocarpus siliculosus TaxID=2880 RepID=D7G8I9_ECTSI|nr:hypothetical protein Esi_0089_0094 [Ectocarpus siliculosus]|eukprot:CBJ28034.1 hypothetical protein Esi_0089_0094 [Ectocarpus siliculosus]
MGKGPLQNQQAFLQTAMPAAPAACPASTSPSRQGGSGGGGRGGGGGSTATQMVNQNFELKRRQQELESMVQSSEAATSQLQERNSQLQEQNRQLREQNTRARAELEESNARADRASAEAEGLRGEAKSKSTEIAGLRRDAKMASTETASLRHDAKTASAEIASLKRKAETAKAESASLRREATTAVEEAASALAQTRAEAEAATARAEAAEKLGVQQREAVAQAEDAARKATKALKAEAAKAAKAAAAAKSENSLRRRSDVLSLAASLEALAAGGSAARTTDTSSQPTTGKKRGRGSATPGIGPRTTAVEPTDEATAPAGAQCRRGGGTTGGVGGYVELPELTKGFCGFLAAYTAQGLPLDALVGLIQTTPSAGGRGGVDNSDGVERGDMPPPPRVTATERAKKKSREATAVKLGKPTALVLPPPAAATATPAPAPDGDSLSAAPADAAAAMTTPPESVVPTARPTTTRREMLNARRAEKEREAREKERIQEEKERERAERQREARKKRKQEAALQKAAEAAARQQADEAELPNAASVHAVAAAAATTDLDEVGGAVVEEVPMPAGDIDDGFFCADVGGVGGSNSVGLIVGGGGGSGGGDGYGMVGAWSHQADGSIAAVGSGSGAALDSGPGEKKKRGKGRSRKPEAVVEPLNMGARSVEGGESGDEGSGKESKKKKRRRSMRLVKAPVKFGDEEPGAGGPLSPEPKLDQSKGLAPKLEPTLAGTAASGQGSESSGRDSCSVDNASVSHVPFSEGGTAAAAKVATSAAIIPAAASQATSDFLVAAAAAAAEGAATTSPTDSISATATAAKMAVDDLFDTAVLQLSAATPPSQQAAATKTAVSGGGREKARGGCAGEGVPTGGERASKAKPNAREAEVAVTEAVVAERLLPYGAEVTDGVTAKDIFEAASSRSWLGDGGGADGGPRGALTGVLATARVLMQKASGPGRASSLQSAVPPEAMRQFESFLTAIVATEACAMKHELRAGTEAGETVPPSAGAGVAAAAAAAAAKAAGGKKKKGVRFCAFDLSTVDMPTDAIEDSDAAAKEVAQCLARVVASSKLLQEGMPKRASGAGGAGKAAAVADGGIGGGLASVVKAFMRGLKTVAGVAEPDSCPLVASARGACRELGTEISTEVVKRAAALLLESFEALEGGAEVAATRCPLRQRLAIMLSALIRFNLRTLLNPPPHKSLSSLHIADSTDKPRKVHEVILLVSEESKPASKKDAFDPTRDGAASAVLSRALRRLYEFSDAVEVMSRAEAFVADMKGKNRDLYGDEEKASRARLHSQSTVDIVAAIRARNFVLELLEFPGVELAVSQARGWGELERLSTELRKAD